MLKTKKIVKSIAVLLAIVLMVSAFPLTGLTFISQKSSAATSEIVNEPISVSEKNEVENLDKSYKHFNNADDEIYVWLTNCGELTREYKVSEYIKTENSNFNYSEKITSDFELGDIVAGDALEVEENEDGFTVSLKDGYINEDTSDKDYVVEYTVKSLSEDNDISESAFSEISFGEVNENMLLTGVMTYIGLNVEITNEKPINFTITNGNGNVSASLYETKETISEDTNLAEITKEDAVDTLDELGNSNYSFDYETKSETTYVVAVKDELGFTSFDWFTSEKVEPVKPVMSKVKSLSTKTADVVRPSNSLDEYGSATNLITQKLDSLNNTTGSTIEKMVVTATMPVRNSEGEDILLKPQSFSVGTYYGFDGTVNVSVYYKTNIDADWVRGYYGECGNTENEIVDVADLHLSNGEYITAVKYEYSQVPEDFTVYVAPEIISRFEYTGLTENFTVETSYTVDNGSSNDFTDTINVENPVVTINVYYKDIDTDEVIPYNSNYSDYGNWSTITRKVQAYSEFSNLGRVNIPNYTIPSDNSDVHPSDVRDYNEDTFSGYVEESDITIIHYYKALSVNVLTPKLTSKYASLFNGDKNAIYFDNLGIKNENDVGNQVLNDYKITISVPAEMNVTEMVTPAFRNGNAVNFTTFYKTNVNNQWRQTDITLSSADMHTITFDLSANEKVTAIELRFTPVDENIPVDFYNINRGILKGIISTDATENVTVTTNIVSIGAYDVVNADGSKAEQTSEKRSSVSLDIIVPQIIDMTDGASARLQAGDKFTYVLNNITTNKQVTYTDYVIKDTLSDMIIVNQLKTGTFNGVIGSKYQIVIEKADGSTITEDCVSTTSKNITINDTVKSITYTFASVGKNFNAASAPVIDATVKDTAQSGEEFKNIINVSAVWTSANEADVQDTVSKTFETTTQIVKPEIDVPEIQISEKLFNNQPASFKIANVTNKGNTEIYDFTVTVDVPNDTTLNSIDTGVWKNTAWTGNQLSVEYKNAAGEWVVLDTFDDLSVNHNVTNSALEDAESVRLVFKVAPLGFTCTTAPSLNTTINSDLDEGHKIGCLVTVTGKFGPTTAMDTTVIPDTSNFKAVDSTMDSSSSQIVVPKFSSPRVGYPESVKYNEKIAYTLTQFANNGETYLYNTYFNFHINQYEKMNITSLTTGTWLGTNGFDVQFVVLNTDDNSSRKVTSHYDGEVNETVTLPELNDNEVITDVMFNFSTVDEQFKFSKSPELTVEFSKDNVEPKETLSVDFTYNTVGGYAENATAPTQEELNNMPHRFVGKIIAETVVMKPEIAIPSLSIPTETMKYREQFTYSVDNIKNSGNTDLSDLYIITSFDRVRVLSMITPEFNVKGKYDILYRTNTEPDKWQTWEKNVDMSKSQELYIPDFDDGEYITDVKLVFGDVAEGFANKTPWNINVINWSDAYDTSEVTINTEVNGVFDKETFSSKNRVLYTPVLPDLAKSNIGKTYPKKAYPTLTYSTVYENLINNTEASIDYFTLSDVFDKNVQPVRLHTGTYTKGLNDGTFSVIYQTNKSGDGWYELVKAQDVSSNDIIEFPELDGEYITAVKLVYGTVNPGFKAVEAPVMEIEFTEALKNHSEITSFVSIEGFIDGRTFTESAEYTATVDYGWVVVELYDNETGAKIAEDGKYYGNMGEEYNIKTYDVPGYELVRIEGNTKGTMKDGYTDTIKAFYKPLPKTGDSPFMSWNFLAGASILLVVGVVSMVYGKDRLSGDKKSKKGKNYA